MHVVALLVGVVAVVVLVAAVCDRLDLPTPLVLIPVGVVGSYLPFVPDVVLEPEVVLFGLLPPLLYAAAQQTSLVDFNANRRPILLLSVGLVIATTLGVGVVVHALLPALGWPAAFAIGAVVAPPDAVAATTIGRRIGLPRRIVTVLEGESLLNDATALVALSTAIAGIVSWRVVGADFVIAAVGGVLVGLVFYVVVGFVRRHVTETTIDTGLGFLTPFAAYVTAEEIAVPTSTDHVAHPSGVVAVVVVGLLLGHRAAVLQHAQARIAERVNWRSIQFLLESAVFLLIGLQASTIITDAFGRELSAARVLALCVATLVTVVVIRVVWVFASRYLLLRPGAGGRAPDWTFTAVLGWAGMRGVVTLAAAFVIPRETPYRDVLLLIAFFVTAATLLVQGTTLPLLARRLRVPSPDPAEDALVRANLLHQASAAGLRRLDELVEQDGDDAHGVAGTIRDRVSRRDNAAWERVGPQLEENPSEVYNRWRRAMIDAERRRVLEVRSSGTVPADVVEEVLAMLDVEESMLDSSADQAGRVKAASAPAGQQRCEHLDTVAPDVAPDSPGECGDCLEEGTAWVHLRMCLGCGHVACCDSSPQRHASRHFERTGHEVMRSAEPGEDWRWCFVDQLTG